mgnify:CR=1 FL=1
MIVEIVVCAEVIIVEDLVDTSASIATKHLLSKHDRLLVTGVATMITEREGICFIRHHNSYKEYKKWFNRRGTQDLIGYVYKKDIEHLIERKVKINLENTK